MDSTLSSLTTWMPRQRWYAAKGRAPLLDLVAACALPRPAGGDPDAEARILLVRDTASTPPMLYQVPIVERAAASLEQTVDAAASALIGSPSPGRVLVDGVVDPAFTSALLGLVTTGGESDGDGLAVTGRPAASAPPVPPEHAARVLSGEQSNTSIIFEPDVAAGGVGGPVICKVFRQLHAGLNPDIELQSALADAGSAHVPGAIGSVDGVWRDDAAAAVHGSLAFAQEFLPGVEDAWRVALRAGAAGEDFTVQARLLGVATAEVHRDLARLFGTVEAGEAERAATAATWHERLATAIAEVPELAPHRAAITGVYERAGQDAWPALQRVHGDYHLGQVLRVPDRGWVLLDFEGEPLRPMAERVQRDLAPRDVAGMLRSFDYVAGSLRLEDPARGAAADAWAAAARSAFVDGYASVRGDAGPGALRDALELDKAVYEAIYEARNRPTWLPIPLGAVERLTVRV